MGGFSVISLERDAIPFVELSFAYEETLGMVKADATQRARNAEYFILDGT